MSEIQVASSHLGKDQGGVSGNRSANHKQTSLQTAAYPAIPSVQIIP